MDSMDGVLKSIAPTLRSRQVDLPKEFRKCPDDVRSPSQFWARKTVRRQEFAPRTSVGDDYSGVGDVTGTCTACVPVRKAQLT